MTNLLNYRGKLSDTQDAHTFSLRLHLSSNSVSVESFEGLFSHKHLFEINSVLINHINNGWTELTKT